jgi:perosamine synthetase
MTSEVRALPTQFRPAPRSAPVSAMSSKPAAPSEAADAGGSALPAIRLYQPDLTGNESAYALECIASSWISSTGPFLDRFEAAFADVVGVPHAIAVSNGTVALHVALHALDLRPGDEVIVPSFTYIASVNAIAQTGATPVFADSRIDDWLIDPQDVLRKITLRTKAIMPVHLYGAVCDMDALGALARERGIAIVEDCAEALGCRLGGRHAGSFGTVGTFSFYGNKTITTGEGGMVVAGDPRVAARVRSLKGQAQSANRRYWHEERGFNYRMTNVSAAIGLAQIERLPAILARKRVIATLYRTTLSDAPVTFQARRPELESGEWLISVLLPDGVDRDAVMESMAHDGIETRPVFHCAHHMPMYAASLDLPNAEALARRGVSLPSYPQMTNAEVMRVGAALRAAIA